MSKQTCQNMVMSLAFALVGLLAVEPQSGYSLSKTFGESLGRYAWSAGHPAIYTELSGLVDRGLIEVVGEGARGSKTYAATGAGRDELRAWLMNDPVGRAKIRNEPVLRLFLLTALEPSDAITVLRRLIEHVDAEMIDLARARARHADRIPAGPEGYGQLAAEYGLRADRAVRDWAAWAIDQLQKQQEKEQQEKGTAP
ncbi:PadR family transcriptional regulator [Arthrobacter sp. NPDC090010]|uniref:PadR family transcriptional regulator n=1 Tax=Arthrobacter sp. NPDC090010 TaxID=3363942 RepID=UPI0037F83611